MRMNHCDTFTFGENISLTVLPRDDNPVDPMLFVLSPMQPQGWAGPAHTEVGPDACLATGFRPKDGEMVLNVENNTQVFLNTSKAVMSTKEESYYYVGFSNDTIYSCSLHKASSNNEIVDLCKDLHPDKALLNFYLLLMNGVRLVFTKTLAFNTIFTIRALLF